MFKYVIISIFWLVIWVVYQSMMMFVFAISYKIGIAFLIIFILSVIFSLKKISIIVYIALMFYIAPMAYCLISLVSSEVFKTKDCYKIELLIKKGERSYKGTGFASVLTSKSKSEFLQNFYSGYKRYIAHSFCMKLSEYEFVLITMKSRNIKNNASYLEQVLSLNHIYNVDKRKINVNLIDKDRPCIYYIKLFNNNVNITELSKIDSVHVEKISTKKVSNGMCYNAEGDFEKSACSSLLQNELVKEKLNKLGVDESTLYLDVSYGPRWFHIPNFGYLINQE